jgi:2-polyprenyl-6-methoxyphenol hydroxylase-like FAD-dependent oxidoreductase
MHIDLDRLETAGPQQSPFCIVGGGIAGLMLAQRLARSGLEVSVFEAGGLQLEDRSQALYQALSIAVGARCIEESNTRMHRRRQRP